MAQPTLSRRERLRAETAAEIKVTALKQMAAGGAAAVSLRAIARDMGMTAGAIYSYYDTRDALINTLISDVYTSLADTLEAAHRRLPEQDTARRVLAHGHAYRQWAIEHPEEFRLVYGDPVPGHDLPEASAASEAALRVCRLLIQMVAAAWPHAAPAHSGGDFGWEDFQPGLIAVLNAERPGLPPAVLALTLRVWGRMHGLVALEIYGHLRTQVADAAKLYHQELLDLIASLGLDLPESDATVGGER
ncbi:TetR/AcrR family transcriptional regulator [Frankia sp. CNm7]|uniref:TetR/AcrR family transcriptional regulator n=1 Tax=Frankia nepalensis TaxID=1836974 RepID=A0A937RFF9_9ACTN|nr:TetR/AcrR family transcriptional regulator [Frankia nepalensis]MBL7502483.1 TetR/AcrR family transcriptional regulator [Frankia nepalensis]MBL7510290.1 TetR/AcrR family transcriptional regulator [Frankia nepalensis]MBL7519428.1 TetR/AcrR family transcriptional regulator [Frankia nepalensis]MBL7629212.1 TetR/AcrR family transcriptional regulator [Frankia nepalensis]